MKTMWKIVTSRSTRAVVGVAVLAFAAMALSMRMDHRDVRERAKDWVTAHQRALPQTLAEFAAYPKEYQDAILPALTPATRSRLWREQLGIILATHPDLTTTQREFLVRASALATPASFEPGAAHPELCDEIALLFQGNQDRHAFLRLGKVVAPARAWRPTFVTMTERVRAKFIAVADTVNCDCRGWGLCECTALLTACEDSPNCNPSNTCGCIWAGPCDQKVCGNTNPLQTVVIKR